MMNSNAKQGFGVFTTIWFGQFVSLLGSGLTGFALGLWVLQRTGSVTDFALISLFTVLPRILLSPLAGALVDRWDRRWTMIWSEAGSGLGTLGVALLLWSGRLEVWHIYVAVSIISTCSAFQWPAYTAASTLLVSRERLGQASGMVQAAQGAAQTFAPLLAGILVGLSQVQIQGVLLIDAVTFCFAILTLLIIRIPKVSRTSETQAKESSLWREIEYGWSYLARRPGLLGLLFILAASNFLLGLVTVLVAPLVLSFASPAALGTVLTTAGMGMFVGSVAMAVWGGPKRRMIAVYGFMVLAGLALLPTGFARSAPLIAAGAFVFLLGIPIISGCSQAIMQGKVAPQVQGRVFAASGMIAGSSMPVAYLCAGPLADRVFEPLLAIDGPLAGTLGRVIGVGPGRGIALAFMVLGGVFILTALAGYLYPRLRRVEDELPDAILETVHERCDAPRIETVGCLKTSEATVEV